MGGFQSKPEIAQSDLTQPWREVKWGDHEANLEFVKNYKPEAEDQLLRILLHGPENAGKSSFINSVQSVLRGRIYRQALANNSGKSFTKEYTTYKVQKEGTSFYPFVFSDIMGLNQRNGALEEDVKLALKGHVKEGYLFNPESPLKEANEFYEADPKPNDCVHVLVCVIPVNIAGIIDKEVTEQIKKIRREASKHHIVQFAVLTKIDELCPEIKDDVKNVYKSRYIKDKMEKFSDEVGIPMNCIFPVKNYHEEIDLNDDIDSLILNAMRNIITSGEDCINFNRNRFESS